MNFIFYFFISFIILYFISYVSYKLNLTDKPNKRKIHIKNTAYTGGIAIYLSYVVSIFIFNYTDMKLLIILLIGGLITLIGFLDDKIVLKAKYKLLLLTAPVLFLIFFNDLVLTNLGYYNYFILKLYIFAVPFTYLSVLLLINAFNYFDGLNGTLSITSLSVIGILYFLTHDDNISEFLIILAIPLIIFLSFNFSLLFLPRLFLGDGGSLLIGYIVAFILIYFDTKGATHSILLGWSISIFIFEFISINIIRITLKKNILNPGFDHLHHLILNKTRSIMMTNILISLTNIILFIIGYQSYKVVGAFLSFLMFIIMFIIYFILRKKYYSSNISL